MVENIFGYVKQSIGEPINPQGSKKQEIIFNKVRFTEFEYNNKVEKGILFFTPDSNEEENTGIFRTSGKVIIKQMKDVCDAIGISSKTEEDTFTFEEEVIGTFIWKNGHQGKYLSLSE